MTKNYKSKDPGIPYFVTFTVVEWLNVFTKPEYMEILKDSLDYCRKEKGMKLYGYVFMTNHIHLVISTEKEDTKLWEIIRDFKKYTAQKVIQKVKEIENRDWILNIMKEEGAKRSTNTQYQFWIQDDYAEEIQSDEFFYQKINYIHDNPVRAKIVINQSDYVWSSAKEYEEGRYESIDEIEL